MDSMTLKLGQVQLMVGRDKAENLRRACALIRRAAEQGAQLVMLPEMFCCPYENEMFRPNSEEQGGPAQQALSALSRELGIWIVGGTIPEREGKRLYNTCYVYDDQGRQAARHRKIHLFDVNVEGGQYFMESDTFAPGNDITLLDTPWGRLGLCVCFDLRFEELCRVMALEGARVLLAEDNELNMEIARFFLQELGAESVPVWNGQEALERFADSAPGEFDMILMDVMMPVMDGYEATRRIRALPRADAKTIPILAMTANAFSDDVRRSREAGMNAHLSKPLSEESLHRAMAEQVKK